MKIFALCAFLLLSLAAVQGTPKVSEKSGIDPKTIGNTQGK